MEDIKIESVKEKYAKELGYDNWEICINDQPNHMVETLMDEVVKRCMNYPHPSDSDIEKICADKLIEVIEKYPDANAETLAALVGKYCLMELRDRMNGETEYVLNDFLNGLLCRKDIHIKNPVCSNSIAEAINNYLQKFRNRDL